MTGQELKDILYQNKISQSEIARKLGLSHQSFNQMLSAADVKTSLLERIAKALDVKMSFFYPMDGNNAVASGNGSVAVTGNNNDVGNVSIGSNADVLQERVKYLEQQIEDKERLLDEKERLIKILMKNEQK